MGNPTPSHCSCGQPTYIFNFFAGHQPPLPINEGASHHHEHKRKHHKKGKKKIIKQVSEEILIQGLPSWLNPRIVKKIGEKVTG
jgi:hypothetical protein